MASGVRDRGRVRQATVAPGRSRAAPLLQLPTQFSRDGAEDAGVVIVGVRQVLVSVQRVFAQSAFKAYSELLKLQNEPPVPGFDDEEPEGGEQ